MQTRIPLQKIVIEMREVIRKLKDNQFNFITTENLTFKTRDILNKLLPYGDGLKIRFYNIRNNLTHKFYAVKYKSLVHFVEDSFPKLIEIINSNNSINVKKDFLEDSKLHNDTQNITEEYDFVQIFYDKLILFNESMKLLYSPLTTEKQDLLNVASFIFENCHELLTKNLLDKKIAGDIAKNRAKNGFAEITQRDARVISAHVGNLDLDILSEYMEVFECDRKFLESYKNTLDKDSIRKKIEFFKNNSSIKDGISDSSLDKIEKMKEEAKKQEKEEERKKAELEARRAALLMKFEEINKSNTPRKRDAEGKDLLSQQRKKEKKPEEPLDETEKEERKSKTYDNTFFQDPTSFSKLLRGRLNEKDIYFTEEFIKADGDCGFTALRVTRQLVVDSLLDLINKNKDIRLFLTDEIENSLLSEEWERNEERWEKIKKEFQHTEAQLDESVRETKKLFHPDETKDMDCNRLIEFITNKPNFSIQLEKLKKVHYEEAESKRNRKLYCQSEEVALDYIRAYQENKLWLGYKTALLYAKQANINLFIWKKIKDTNKIELMDDDLDKLKLESSEQPKSTIHMVFSGGYTHFNLLIESSIPKQELLQEKIDLDNKQNRP